MGDKLFVVYGAGNDAVGLVERITTAIAEIGGNLIDLRQDSLHGLFTIYLVADLAGTDLRLEQFREVIAKIAEDTGLDLHTAKHVSAPRPAEARNLLLVLLGKDRPGIISRVSKDLSSHRINIEFSRMVAREGIFLMELVTDISQCTLPPENLEAVVREHMAAVGIASMFQSRNVFNPSKRVIVFDIGGSFIPRTELEEIMQQAGLTASQLPDSPAAAAGRLEGLPAEVFHQVARSVQVTRDSAELVQTLKRMGYRVALTAQASTPFVEVLRERLALDYAVGVDLTVDDDSQALTGTCGPARDTADVVALLSEQEGVDRADISVIAGAPPDEPPGLRIDFNMRLVLDYLNQHVLSPETLSGVLGSFGRFVSPMRGDGRGG